MKKKVVVLGCGMVGAVMVRDLAEDAGFEVVVADFNPDSLDTLRDAKNIKTIQADLSTPDSVRSVVEDVDLVVGAMPSVFGYQTLKTVIECGKPFTDISFMIEDPCALDESAKERGITVVYDCGVAPGLANMIIGHCHAQLDETTDIVYYVGGLPKRRTWPYEYKAPFAPSDVLEEYTRPARMMENGKVVLKPALSEPELIDFPQVSTLEAFNTDGLRSLLHTVEAHNMKEKTLRYPGHCELMRVFRETGLFDKETIEVDGVRVRPLDVTSKLLFRRWRLEPGEPEFTVLRVIVKGKKDNQRLRYQYDLYDETDTATGHHSMARTTGYPNAIMARLIARGDFTKPGVFPPERIGAEPGMMDLFVRELADRGVKLTCDVEKIDVV